MTRVSLLAGALIWVIVVIDPDRADVFAEPKLEVARVGALLLALAAGGALAASVRRGTARPRVHLADGLVAMYLLWSLLAFVVAPDAGQQWRGERFQFQGLSSVLVYVAVYAAARAFASDVAKARWLVWWVVAGSVFAASYGLLQRAGRDPIWSELLDGRIFSTLGNPNTLASLLVIALPLALVFVWSDDVVERVVGLCSVVAVLAAVTYTESRGGFLAAAVGVGVFVFVAPRPPRRVLVQGAAVAAVAIALVIVVSPLRETAVDTWERAASALESGDESRRFHVDGWRATVAMIGDHPWFGVGHERFPVEFPHYRDEVLSPEAVARFAPYRLESPHNVPLAIAAAAGLPAVLLYFGVVGAALMASWRALAEQTVVVGMWAGVAAHLIADLFVTADLSSTMVFWALLGSLVSVGDGVDRRSLLSGAHRCSDRGHGNGVDSTAATDDARAALDP